MKIQDSIALVTGANRGIGRAVVSELLARGAAKVYAGVRNPDSAKPLVDEYGDRVVPLKLDVTSSDDVAAAAETASDVQILVNNAGYYSGPAESVADNPAGFLDEMQINVYGPLSLAAAFRKAVTAARGTIVNVNSIASFVSFPGARTYSASKAAAHSVTQALRAELGPVDVSVVGVYPGPVDTDMASEFDLPKATPASVAGEIVDGIENGTEQVFTDDMAKQFETVIGGGLKELEQQSAAMGAGAS